MKFEWTLQTCFSFYEAFPLLISREKYKWHGKLLQENYFKKLNTCWLRTSLANFFQLLLSTIKLLKDELGWYKASQNGLKYQQNLPDWVKFALLSFAVTMWIKAVKNNHREKNHLFKANIQYVNNVFFRVLVTWGHFFKMLILIFKPRTFWVSHQSGHCSHIYLHNIFKVQ